MNRIDAEMLMGSLDSLTNSGFKKRALDQQDRHQSSQEAYQNKHLEQLIREHQDTNQLGQDRLAEEMAHHANLEANQSSHYAATEAGQSLARELANKKNQNDQLHKTLLWLSDGVKHGAIKADVANQQLGGIAKTAPPEAIAALQATPLGAAILSGQPVFQDVPVKTAGNAATANMKDSQYEQQLGDELMGAMSVGDADTADLGKRYDDFKAINARKGTGNVPYDTKTTTTVADMSKPFDKVATTQHIRPGQPPVSPLGGTPPTAQPPAGSATTVVHSKAEYDQLPKGAKFIDAQGKNWVKP